MLNTMYTGSNYSAKKEICGSKDNPPRPKDSNLLQSFIYFLESENANPMACSLLASLLFHLSLI